MRGVQQGHTVNKLGITYHENEENEEDKGREVDGSEHWIGLFNF